MKTATALLVASTFLVGSALAQSPTAPASAPRASDASSPTALKAEEQRNKDVEKHIVDLHAKLKITPAEESQWSDVVKAMRNNATEIEVAIDKREVHGSAIDDLNAYGDVVQAHADGIKKLAKAFSPLYASMPADQKAIADEVFVHQPHEGKEVTKH